jgi:hypothetical protein
MESGIEANDITRIYDAIDYARQSKDYEKAIGIIESILNGETDEEIMDEDDEDEEDAEDE